MCTCREDAAMQVTKKSFPNTEKFFTYVHRRVVQKYLIAIKILRELTYVSFHTMNASKNTFIDPAMWSSWKSKCQKYNHYHNIRNFFLFLNLKH